jgi:phosphotransferase system  glucose/maltose/N-acetylglucosamine-specific IIC component
MFVRNYLCGLKVSTDGTHYMTIKLDNYYRLFNSGGVTGNPGQYMQGKFPFMIFGLPMAALAMIFLVPKNTDNRKQAMAIIGSSALTCLLTGITEPLEFTFLFLAP